MKLPHGKSALKLFKSIFTKLSSKSASWISNSQNERSPANLRWKSEFSMTMNKCSMFWSQRKNALRKCSFNGRVSIGNVSWKFLKRKLFQKTLTIFGQKLWNQNRNFILSFQSCFSTALNFNFEVVSYCTNLCHRSKLWSEFIGKKLGILFLFERPTQPNLFRFSFFIIWTE